MRPFLTTFFRLCLFLFLLLAFNFFPKPAVADEISFGETYAEKLTQDGDVIWSGSSTLDITLPWEGVNIDDFDGGTEINISIGDFLFSQVLDAGEELYEPGVRAARFIEKDSDNDGNEVTVLFLDVTWNTKTFTISGTFRNFSSASAPNFFGVPSHSGVAGSFQETNSADISFGPLSASYPVIVSGRTIVTHKVLDEVDYDLNNIELSGSADLPPNDTTAPSVSISSPSANGRLLTPVITGKASDNRGISEVYYRIGTDEFALANGTTNWSANVTLQPGTNVVEVKSIDFAGNESPILTRSFFYVVTAPLTVEINNPDWGSTTPTNGQLLDISKTYSIIAKPAPGYKFSQWLGDINSLESTIQFVMASNFLLQAEFIPNPFIPIQGTYNGLFADANGVSPSSAGYLTTTIAESGAFSGKIFLAGARHSFSGQFAVDGHADKIISRRGKPPLNLHMQLGFDGGLSGTVSQGDVSSDVQAELAQSTTNLNKAQYTLLIPPAADPSAAPGGYGFGSTSVDPKGKLRFHGILGNNAQVSQSTMISQSGRWPLFLSHSRGKGVLLGWLSFADEVDSDIRGDVTWAMLPRPLDKFYPAGFTNAGTALGSLYLRPPSGTPVLNASSGSIEFAGGNLSVPLTNNFVLNSNKLIVASSNQTTLRISTPSGLLSGRFIHSDTRKPVSIRGAILQKPMWGGGFFRGTNQTGAILLLPNPPN